MRQFSINSKAINTLNSYFHLNNYFWISKIKKSGYLLFYYKKPGFSFGKNYLISVKNSVLIASLINLPE
jgi:hypothetical protein